MRVNLHTHSTVSDGALTPSELIEKLYEDNVEICALTDHDKLDGLLEANKAALQKGILFINGIEISTKIFELELDFINPLTHTIHMLGLGFDYEILKRLYQNRAKEKNNKLEKLNFKLIDLGYHIPIIIDVSSKSEIAKALVEKGYAVNKEAAFETIINKEYPRWSDEIGISEAVSMIHQAGGVLLWAHPFEILNDINKVHLTEHEIEQIAARLKEVNVDGIEVYYEKYSNNQVSFLKRVQERYGFITSAGTDYHGKKSQPSTFIEIDVSLIEEVVK